MFGRQHSGKSITKGIKTGDVSKRHLWHKVRSLPLFSQLSTVNDRIITRLFKISTHSPGRLFEQGWIFGNWRLFGNLRLCTKIEVTTVIQNILASLTEVLIRVRLVPVGSKG